MRVYIPDQRAPAINEILKELYVLRQAIDFDSSSVDSRLKMVDKIRRQVQSLLDDQENV